MSTCSHPERKSIKKQVFFPQPRQSFRVCTAIQHLSLEYILSIVISLYGWHIRLCAQFVTLRRFHSWHEPPACLVSRFCQQRLQTLQPQAEDTSHLPQLNQQLLRCPVQRVLRGAAGHMAASQEVRGIVLTSSFDSGNSAAGTQRLSVEVEGIKTGSWPGKRWIALSCSVERPCLVSAVMWSSYGFNLSIYNVYLIYGVQFWVMTKRTRSRTRLAEISFLRRLAGHTPRDGVRR